MKIERMIINFEYIMNTKKYIILIIGFAFSLFACLTSCNKDDDPTDDKDNANGPQIVMTTQNSGEFSFKMAGTGNVTVDWGDGTVIRTFDLVEYNDNFDTEIFSLEHLFKHDYTKSTSHTINIKGEKVTHFSVHYQNDCRLTGVDVSKNGWLTSLDCLCNYHLTKLDLGNISSLTRLICQGVPITNLDVSKCIELTYLDCYGAHITNLDISNNKSLKDLRCGGNNRITNLDVSSNIILTSLFCHSTPITNLDVSKNILLTAMYCNNNQLTNLDVSNNIMLASLVCYNNRITNLDVSNNIMLTSLDCADNQLTNLDMSKNIALKTLYCKCNQLTNLDFSNNIALYNLDCRLNDMDEHALNNMFESLNDSLMWKVMSFTDNKGASSCDRSIAENKGWTIFD